MTVQPFYSFYHKPKVIASIPIDFYSWDLSSYVRFLAACVASAALTVGFGLGVRSLKLKELSIEGVLGFLGLLFLYL